MKENMMWFRGEDEHLSYIEQVKKARRYEFRSQAIRFILDIAREQNIGLSLK